MRIQLFYKQDYAELQYNVNRFLSIFDEGVDYVDVNYISSVNIGITYELRGTITRIKRQEQ